MALSRRHPAALFAVLVVGLATTGVAYAAVTTGTTPQAVAASQTQIDEGKEIFLQGCSSCHGLAAQGGSDVPSLICVGAAAVDFQVGTGRMPMAGPGVQAMPKTPVYNEEQIAALAAYVASLGAGPAIPTEDQLKTNEADLAIGGELFRTNCAQCHSFSGRGGALSNGRMAPSLMESEAKRIYEAMITGPQAMPVFNDKTITPADKQAIIKYIQELQKQENPGGFALGRLGTVTEGLFLFVVGLGALIGVAVWIGAKAK
ncbi:MAG: c-type cytochrome [Actinobacteria bacterium]|nr:c-type cytochrome [Actinomycetota bacterium]